MEQEQKMSAGQRRCIYALAKAAGVESDALHDVVDQVTGVESIAELTSCQAGKVIEHLKELAGQAAPGGWMTDAQRGKVYALCREMGWLTDNGAVDEKRLEGFIRARFGIARLQWVRMDVAGKAINALSAMSKGGRGERRMKGGIA